MNIMTETWQQELVKRRKQLLQNMKSLDENSIAIMPAAQFNLRNGDVHYPFRQDSNFFYLTGFPEADAVAVFAPGHPDGEFILFNHPEDPTHEIWHGKRIGQNKVCEYYGVDQAFSINALDQTMPKLLQGRGCVYYGWGETSIAASSFQQRLFNWIDASRTSSRSGHCFPQQFKSVDLLLNEMRLFKNPHEIGLMRKAAEISTVAHQRAMRTAKTATWEYELAAEILYEFYRQGAQGVAYESIVGAGANACILHYIDNNSALKDGELILIDAGAEYQGYAADITRTFPRNGRFSAEQKAIYEIVLRAQDAGIAKVVKGTLWEDIQTTTAEVITAGLLDLGILRGNLNELIEKKAYQDFYMHHFGHWLGMDVHDVGNYKINNQWRPLEPGMVLTVEPGIYIRENPSVDPKWWNIGVRIEDDVLVTKGEADVLSDGLIKKIDDVEAFMRS